MDITAILTTVVDFVKENFALFILVIICLAIIIINYIKKKNYKKKAEKALKQLQESQKEKPMEEPKIETTTQIDFPDFLKNFSDEVAPNKEEDMMIRLDGFIKSISAEGTKIDSSIKSEFEALRIELNATNKKRLQIKEFGIKLGELYNKLRMREEYITNLMRNMEPLIKDDHNR